MKELSKEDREFNAKITALSRGEIKLDIEEAFLEDLICRQCHNPMKRMRCLKPDKDFNVCDVCRAQNLLEYIRESNSRIEGAKRDKKCPDCKNYFTKLCPSGRCWSCDQKVAVIQKRDRVTSIQRERDSLKEEIKKFTGSAESAAEKPAPTDGKD